MNKFKPTPEQIEKMRKAIDKFDSFMDEVLLIGKEKYQFNCIQSCQIIISAFQSLLEDKLKEKEEQNEN